jgi:hypothetical protein
MVPKSGSRLPKKQILPSGVEFAHAIGTALRGDLGGSHQAAKTVMAWTGVSDRTARAWLNGQSSPSGLHLIGLAAHCHLVMATVLRLTGHGQVALALDLERVEATLEQTLATARRLRTEGQ